MKQEVKFICDYCGKKYDTTEACEKCENSHYIPSEIMESRYKNGTFPDTVSLKMANGKSAIYTFLKPIVDKNGNGGN